MYVRHTMYLLHPDNFIGMLRNKAIFKKSIIMSSDTNQTDLLSLIDKSNDEIPLYLGDVRIKDFKEDIKELVRKSIDKEPIRQALESLKKLL